MAKFFSPNIGRAGRIARAIFALILLVTGVCLLKSYFWAALFLFAFSAFAFYEALRGWCVMRACGVKTKY
jgi:hypothetical protein